MIKYWSADNVDENRDEYDSQNKTPEKQSQKTFLPRSMGGVLYFGCHNRSYFWRHCTTISHLALIVLANKYRKLYWEVKHINRISNFDKIRRRTADNAYAQDRE